MHSSKWNINFYREKELIERIKMTSFLSLQHQEKVDKQYKQHKTLTFGKFSCQTNFFSELLNSCFIYGPTSLNDFNYIQSFSFPPLSKRRFFSHPFDIPNLFLTSISSYLFIPASIPNRPSLPLPSIQQPESFTFCAFLTIHSTINIPLQQSTSF